MNFKDNREELNTKAGIMQPYFFPYIGYFQYICTVDKFVFYDDVAFIKQGWINRNRVLVKGEPFLFTVPVEQVSSFRSIKETKIHQPGFFKWKTGWLKTIEQNYKKAKCFNEVFSLIHAVLEEAPDSIGVLAERSVMSVLVYLNVRLPEFVKVETFKNEHLHGQERVLDICRQLHADVYINPVGGMELYHKDDFRERNTAVYFLQSVQPRYPQFEFPWVPALSIIDVLMHNTVEEVSAMLFNYELI